MSERISAPRAGHTPECASQTYEMREGLPVRDYCDCKPTPAPDAVKLPERVETSFVDLVRQMVGLYHAYAVPEAEYLCVCDDVQTLRAEIAAALEKERDPYRDMWEESEELSEERRRVGAEYRDRAEAAEARVRELEEAHAKFTRADFESCCFGRIACMGELDAARKRGDAEAARAWRDAAHTLDALAGKLAERYGIAQPDAARQAEEVE